MDPVETRHGIEKKARNRKNWLARRGSGFLRQPPIRAMGGSCFRFGALWVGAEGFGSLGGWARAGLGAVCFFGGGPSGGVYGVFVFFKFGTVGSRNFFWGVRKISLNGPPPISGLFVA